MLKKSISMIVLLVFLFGVGAQALQSKVLKASAKAKPLAKKLAVKPKIKEVVKPSAISSDEVVSQEDKIADIKEEANRAIADLKGQVEKVKGDNSDAKVSGQILYRWQKYTENAPTGTYNNFDIDRAYLDIKKKLDSDINVRLTLDVARLATATTVSKGSAGETVTANSSTQQLFDYLKYAYVEMPVAISPMLQLVPFSLTAKVGLQHTAWIDWADKILNLRYVAKSLVDNEGIMSSADFGIGAIGKISQVGMPELEYHATVLNGAGYKSAETNSSKNVALRLNSTLFDDANIGKVVLGAFGHIQNVGANASSASQTKQAGALVAVSNDKGVADIEYIYGTGISAYSLGVRADNVLDGIFNGIGLFAKLDNYDPNRSKSNDETSRTLYGISYDWGKDVKIALDMQTASYGVNSSNSLKGKSQSILYLQTGITI